MKTGFAFGMKVLLIGYRGQLGSDLRLAFEGEDLTLAGREDVLVQDAEQVDAIVNAARPDLILNCSAFHVVDECEERPEEAFAVNLFGVGNLARAARRAGAVLVHFSTDYVFDSERRTPYVESDAPCPKCVYGVTKAAGELLLAATWEKHFIFRVSGLYGYAGSRVKGANFVEMMIEQARLGKPLRVVNDQRLTPTSTRDVATAVRRVTSTTAWGLYHLTNAGECSWYEFACAIFELTGMHPDISPVNSDSIPTKARRPRYSVLDNFRLRSEGFDDLPHWRDALARYLAGRAAAGRD
jgi:dTDP-4-dehydrorhamnose reductase